jgi:two-component system cell cycle response regulator DivK
MAAQYRVLVVDDSNLNRKVVSTVLQSCGFEVLEAVDGEQAFEITTAELPDLVLMDVQLPKVDGYEVTRRLRRQPVTQHIPVIALTAHAMAGEKERAAEAGCDGYISKPVNTRTLVGEIMPYLTDREGRP